MYKWQYLRKTSFPESSSSSDWGCPEARAGRIQNQEGGERHTINKQCPIVGPNSNSMSGSEVPGVPWPYTNIATPEDCQQLCESNSECNGFHYYGAEDDYGSGSRRLTCWIKRGVIRVHFCARVFLKRRVCKTKTLVFQLSKFILKNSSFFSY